MGVSKEVVRIYCNSCMGSIKTDEIEYCSQCHVPLHKSCANHCMDCSVALCDSCYSANNFKCENCYNPELTFKTIRRSHLELFNQCPYSLYLQLVKGVVAPNGDYADLGIMLHEIIDMMQASILDLSGALLKFEVMFAEKIEESNEHRADFHKTGVNVLNTFNDYLPLFGKKFETEKNIIFSLDETLPSVSCTLDRVDFVGNEIHISDWKTGKPMSGQKLVTDLQPPLYIKGIKEEYGKYPESFTLYYLAHNKTKKYCHVGNCIYEVVSGKTTYTLDVNEALERTKVILNKINNKQFSMSKETGEWYCKNMCYFYKSGICASSSAEKWKVLSDKYRGE